MTVVEVVTDGETPTRQIEEVVEGEAQKHLDAVKSQALKDGVACETFISYGDPHQNIVDEAVEERVDMIIIGSVSGAKPAARTFDGHPHRRTDGA